MSMNPHELVNESLQAMRDEVQRLLASGPIYTAGELQRGVRLFKISVASLEGRAADIEKRPPPPKPWQEERGLFA